MNSKHLFAYYYHKQPLKVVNNVYEDWIAYAIIYKIDT